VSVTDNEFNLTPADITGCARARTLWRERHLSEYGKATYSGRRCRLPSPSISATSSGTTRTPGPGPSWRGNQGNEDDPVSFAAWSSPVTDGCSTAHEVSSGTCNSGFGQDAGLGLQLCRRADQHDPIRHDHDAVRHAAELSAGHDDHCAAPAADYRGDDHHAGPPADNIRASDFDEHSGSERSSRRGPVQIITESARRSPVPPVRARRSPRPRGARGTGSCSAAATPCGTVRGISTTS